jgi:hypothetical protein
MMSMARVAVCSDVYETRSKKGLTMTSLKSKHVALYVVPDGHMPIQNCFRQKLYRKSKHTLCVQIFVIQKIVSFMRYRKNLVQPDRSQAKHDIMQNTCDFAG